MVHNQLRDCNQFQKLSTWKIEISIAAVLGSPDHACYNQEVFKRKEKKQPFTFVFSFPMASSEQSTLFMLKTSILCLKKVLFSSPRNARSWNENLPCVCLYR